MTKLTVLSQVGKIKTLSTPDLRSLYYRFQKYFYTAGYNIGFHTVITQKETKDFEKSVATAIEKQILHIANVDKLYDLVRHREKAIDRNMLLLLGAAWLAFDKSISIGKIGILAYLLWAGEQGGQIALDKIVPDRIFDLKDPNIERQFLERTAFLISTVDKTTQKWIVTTIEGGLENGLEMPKIAEYLKSEAKKIATERAGIITETELMNALNIVEVTTFEKNGIEKHKWITSADERVEELCLANEAAGAIDVGDIFPSGTENPPAHIACRCFLLPVLPEYLDNSVWTG